MRMGPFSNAKVIAKLNNYFVPVQVSNDRYLKSKLASTEERQLLLQVWAEAERKKLPQGTVHVYILRSDGSLLTSAHVRDTSRTAFLNKFLEDAIETLKAKPGDKLVTHPRECQASDPTRKDQASQITLRISSAYRDRPSMAGEDMVTLSRDEWQQLIPSQVNVDDEWKVDERLTKKMFVNLSPYTEDWDTSHNQFSKCQLTAKLLSNEDGTSKTVLRGKLSMTHNRHRGKSNEKVDATLVGFVVREGTQLPKISIATNQASYARMPFDGLIVTVDGCSPEASANKGAKRQ